MPCWGLLLYELGLFDQARSTKHSEKNQILYDISLTISKQNLLKTFFMGELSSSS